MFDNKKSLFVPVSNFEVITVPASILYVLINDENHLFLHKETIVLEQYEDVYFSGF